MKQVLEQNDSHFDFAAFEQEAIEQLYQGDELHKVMKPLIQKLLNKALEGERDALLNYPKNGKSPDGNHRNGTNSKIVKSSVGNLEINIPRDRNGEFEPTLVKKHERKLDNFLENKVISMYSMGMSYRDIMAHISELYGMELSEAQLTTITDKIWPEIIEWQSRPLDKVYPFVYMDAMFFKVRHESKVISKALYIVIGINQEGYKEILGFYLRETEGAKFWLSVLTDLQNRGLEDILIACIDNLSGFAEAIESMYPKTKVQLCIIHQIRNSLKYVASKDKKEFIKDLKTVYKASIREQAEENLLKLDEKWGKKYPIVINSWNNNWERLSNYFDYSENIRKVIYTTNMIEGLNRQIRKVTKTKGAFPSDKALLKQVYLAFNNITKKWNQPMQNWSLTLSQLSIIFEGRLKLTINS